MQPLQRQRGALLRRAQERDAVAVEVQLLEQRRGGGEQHHLLPRQSCLAETESLQPAQCAGKADGQHNERVEAQPVEPQPL